MVFLGAVDAEIPAEALPWAATGEERERRERHAAQIVGQSIVAVRYYTIASEWRYEGFDSLAYGVQLETDGGLTFSATWVIDIEHVGLSFRAEPMRPRWLSGRVPYVIRDVTWPAAHVEGVTLRWWKQKPPGEADGCHTVSLHFGERTIHLVLAEAIGDDRLAVQDDSVAVVFDDAVAREARVGPWMPATS